MVLGVAAGDDRHATVSRGECILLLVHSKQTSTGKVLLAAAADGEPPGRRPRRQKLTPRTITDPDGLKRELEEARKRGWATAVEELEEGYVAVGAPVRDHIGRAVAAISVGGPAARLTAKRIPSLARRVVAAADRISRQLGAWRAPGGPPRPVTHAPKAPGQG